MRRAAILATTPRRRLFPVRKILLVSSSLKETIIIQRSTFNVIRSPFYSAWHTGHQNRLRPANTCVLTSVSQIKHGRPARRYT